MEILIEKEAEAYILKNKVAGITIEMIIQETTGGCACGVTKKYYMPEIRLGLNESKRDNYNIEEVGGVSIACSKRICSENITIGLERMLFMKNLTVEGIERELF